MGCPSSSLAERWRIGAQATEIFSSAFKRAWIETQPTIEVDRVDEGCLVRVIISLSVHTGEQR
jgi:hypothetical protein